ncbi:MAG: NAD-dependent epimerase/dehydratase family protein [Candidatus Hermodarchaeota archaeon]
MSKKILITGGAGFIGSHLVDNLFEDNNHKVTIYDNLSEQVHRSRETSPDYLNDKAEFIKGSIADYNKIEEVIKDHEIIFHLAARVGVGQSMYQISNYMDNNVLGLANVLNILVNSNHNVEKVIIASSNTVYGEGKTSCGNCGIVFPEFRDKAQLDKKQWDLKCPTCGNQMKSLLTDELTPLNPNSIYALSKKVQEDMSIMVSQTYGLKLIILRFFLVYGPRQALSNPYTGVCSIFGSRLLRGKPPIIFEDGMQTRDFVYVDDVCRALILAMNNRNNTNEIFNVGTGIPIKIKDVAEIIIEKLNPKLKPIYSQQYRVGDIRHCVADISKIKSKLGFEPKFSFKMGIEKLVNWIKAQDGVIDKTGEAISELEEKGLLK